MKRLMVFVMAVAFACSTFEGLAPDVQEGLLPYGGITARVNFSGYAVNPDGSDSVAVSLDSAIQGFGLQRIYYKHDSAMFDPVLVGDHQVTLRVPLPNCMVQDGPDRTVRVDSNRRVFIDYSVTCTVAERRGALAVHGK